MDKFDTLISKSKKDIASNTEFVDSVMHQVQHRKVHRQRFFSFQLFTFPAVAVMAAIALLIVAGWSLTLSNTSTSKNKVALGTAYAHSLASSIAAKSAGSDKNNSNTTTGSANTSATANSAATGSTTTAAGAAGEASLTAAINNIDDGITQSSQDISNSINGLNDQQQAITVPTN